MKHKHHIISKHMGGSDDPSNLVEVTITQHAMFHYCNWMLYGKWEDKCAWQLLVDNVKNPLHVKGRKLTDSQRQAISERMKGNTHGAGVVFTEERKEKIRQKVTGKKHTEETKEKLREINLGRKHTEESKKKCSEAGKKGGRKKGSIPWNKGVRKNETTIG